MCQCAPDTFSFSAILGSGMCFLPAQKPLLFIWQDLCAEMRILMYFLKKNWRLCFGCYIFIYLPWFFYLEKKITMETPNLHIINNAIDDMIPFCVYFIIPYMLWFIYVIGACIYMLFKASDTEFLRFALCLTIGMSVSLLICMIYPSGLTPMYSQVSTYTTPLPSTSHCTGANGFKSIRHLTLLH